MRERTGANIQLAHKSISKDRLGNAMSAGVSSDRKDARNKSDPIDGAAFDVRGRIAGNQRQSSSPYLPRYGLSSGHAFAWASRASSEPSGAR
jgi:hypothetical protein